MFAHGTKPQTLRRPRLFKFLIKLRLLKFDEKSGRIFQKTSSQSQEQLQPCLLGFSSKAVDKLPGIMGRVMFFLVRMAFWLCVVCILLPSGTKSTPPDAQIDASEAVTVASAAVSDMRGFCERQPDACVTGGKVMVALGQKAEAGARTIYEFITKLREKSASNPAPGTLTPTDLAPAWHAPVPLPPRREIRDGRPAA